MHFRFVLGAVVASSSLVQTSHGQVGIGEFFPEIARFTSPDPAANDNFGLNLSISGDTAIIGNWLDDDNGMSSGSAHVYVRQGNGAWSQAQKLIGSDTTGNDNFGISVAISGDVLVIGARNTENEGGAYIYERQPDGSWMEASKVYASDAQINYDFGDKVAVSGDTVLVAVRKGNQALGSFVGSVYVYERDASGEWVETDIVTASDAAEGDSFGINVAISGDIMVVGAYGDDDNGIASGSAYIYERDAGGCWCTETKLMAPDGASGDEFGFSVDVDGDRVIIGARQDNIVNKPDVGSAHIYERNDEGTWSHIHKMTPADGEVGDLFGHRVRISGDTAVITSILDGDGSASVYIGEQQADGGWSLVRKLTASESLDDGFGYGLDISGNAILCGVPYDDNDDNSGSVYSFEVNTVINMDFGNTAYDSIESAIGQAIQGERLAVRSNAFNVDGIINTSNKPMQFIAVEPIVMGMGSMFLPADGTIFIDDDDSDSIGYSTHGRLIAPENGQLIFNSLEMLESSQFQQNGCTLLMNGPMATTAGVSYLSGEVLAVSVSTGAEGVNRVSGDTRIYSDYENTGATIIQEGILYIYGNLVNNGTLTGEYNNGFAGGDAPESGDGFNIGGNYTVGAGASLSMPDPVWWLRVGGNLDIAIDDPAKFTMADATIQLHGLAPGRFQEMETLGADLGATEDGFDASNFPIGRLLVTSDSKTRLVNNHVNATDDPCEALYVNELVVSAGGYLQTNGCRIYAREAVINGRVDDPDNVIIIGATCVGDYDGNGLVDGVDLAFLLGAWNTINEDVDLSGDGLVDGVDLAILLGGWGFCR